MTEFASEPISLLCEIFNVNLKKGLSNDAIVQIRSHVGYNELKESPRRSFFFRFLDQFNDNLAFILLAAALISFTISLYDQNQSSEPTLSLWSFVEPFVILLILIANAIVGLVQESNADTAIKALRSYSPLKCKVLRDGEILEINARELVPGDIVKLAVGDRVPADCRIFYVASASGLKVDQSLITGESNSVSKSSDIIPSTGKKILLQDQLNIAFSGTLITMGHCDALVIATGIQTEMGKIANAIDSPKKSDCNDDLGRSNSSPLKKRLDEFGDNLAKAIAVLCIFVWIIYMPHFRDEEFKNNWFRGALYYFKMSVALAVAAIPEGLSVIITTCLSLGTRRMAQQNAIVRYLPAVETIGSTTMICTDKTGTLTTNSMSARVIFTISSSTHQINETSASGTTYDPSDGSIIVSEDKKEIFSQLQCALARCTEATVKTENGQVTTIGEPTEISLVTLALKISKALNSKISNLVPFATLDFDRNRKSSSIIYQFEREFILYVKGAPENILSRCSYVMLEDGSIKEASESIRSSITAKSFTLAKVEALRLLAIGIKRIPLTWDKENLRDPSLFSDVESDLTFISLIGIEDPPRPEAAIAIKSCKEAGIGVVMITGDSQATAEAVARKIGLVSDTDKESGYSITGAELDEIPFDDHVQLAHVCKKGIIFSRTEPAHKIRLVEAFTKAGHIVAMTGDGINDAPALKKAHIGIAMGNGSDVAKEAADLVLADNNFATIAKAISEGRTIFDNTQQFIRYLISSNIGEVVSLLLGSLFGIGELLAPVQLLWVNLVTDGLPATALSFNPIDPNIMKRAPRPTSVPLVDSWRFIRYLLVGTYVGIATLFGYLILDGKNTIPGSFLPSTMALSVLVLIEMFNACNSVSETESILVIHPWSNPHLIGAIFLSLGLHLLILHHPFLSAIFKVCPLSPSEWCLVFCLSAPVVLLDEILKYISRVYK